MVSRMTVLNRSFKTMKDTKATNLKHSGSEKRCGASSSTGLAIDVRQVFFTPLLVLLAALVLVFLSIQPSFAEDPVAKDLVLNERQTKGRNLAFERKKGNCLACHQIEGGELAGTVGPPLLIMQARFPDREVLREQIADARIRNPNTLMPPFAAHGILSSEEIDAIIDFLYAL